MSFNFIQPPKPAKNSAKADKKKEEAERKAREEGILCTNMLHKNNAGFHCVYHTYTTV